MTFRSASYNTNFSQTITSDEAEKNIKNENRCNTIRSCYRSSSPRIEDLPRLSGKISKINDMNLKFEKLQNWHTAANAVVDANPHLVQEWAIAVGKEQCSVIWQDDALCRYFVGGGFINWAESWLKVQINPSLSVF